MHIKTIDALCAYLTRTQQAFARDGDKISAGGYLNLCGLTSLPDGASLSAGGGLYLRSLTSEIQRYAGTLIRLRTIDGICTRLIVERRVGETALWSAQYFKGDLENNPRCYVAQIGESYTHGDSAEAALRDLRFKLAQADFDLEDLVATIKRRGTVEFNDYRLITGACASGLREGLRARGIDPDIQALPLDQALALSRDGYGGEAFRRALGAAL